MPDSRSSVLELRVETGPGEGFRLRDDWSGSAPSEAAPVVSLSKTECYLADNIYVSILSCLMDRVQQQSNRTAESVPNWEFGALSSGGTRRGGGPFGSERVCVRTRSSLRDLDRLFHVSQRCRAGLSWFAPPGLESRAFRPTSLPESQFSRKHGAPPPKRSLDGAPSRVTTTFSEQAEELESVSRPLQLSLCPAPARTGIPPRGPSADALVSRDRLRCSGAGGR